MHVTVVGLEGQVSTAISPATDSRHAAAAVPEEALLPSAAASPPVAFEVGQHELEPGQASASGTAGAAAQSSCAPVNTYAPPQQPAAGSGAAPVEQRSLPSDQPLNEFHAAQRLHSVASSRPKLQPSASSAQGLSPRGTANTSKRALQDYAALAAGETGGREAGRGVASPQQSLSQVLVYNLTTSTHC